MNEQWAKVNIALINVYCDFVVNVNRIIRYALRASLSKFRYVDPLSKSR